VEPDPRDPTLDGEPPARLALPVRLTLETRGGRPLFDAHRPTTLAVGVFELAARHPDTVAACLLPARLDWLLADGLRLAECVGLFRARSTDLAHRHGRHGKLWRRCRWGHVRGPRQGLREAAAAIVDAPRRLGLVASARDYPLRILRLDRASPAAGSAVSGP
jgi:hypothetical protein